MLKNLLKSFLLVGLLVVPLTSMTAASATVQSGQGKVQVCHRPRGNPGNVQIVSVGAAALGAHLAHGDDYSFGDACYVVVGSDIDATTSEQACQSDFGGNLASIHSEAEDDFISQLVDPDATGGITARIGGTAPSGFCSGAGATYAWTDGSPWDFSNWRTGTGEPNCSGSGAPASIQFWPNTNFGLSGWNDTPNEDALGSFVCKYRP